MNIKECISLLEKKGFYPSEDYETWYDKFQKVKIILWNDKTYSIIGLLEEIYVAFDTGSIGISHLKNDIKKLSDILNSLEKSYPCVYKKNTTNEEIVYDYFSYQIENDKKKQANDTKVYVQNFGGGETFFVTTEKNEIFKADRTELTPLYNSSKYKVGSTVQIDRNGGMSAKILFAFGRNYLVYTRWRSGRDGGLAHLQENDIMYVSAYPDTSLQKLELQLLDSGLSGIKQLQNYSSTKTSLPSNEPKGFKLIDWQKGTVNLDLGGGKTTFGTDYLKAKGVKNLIFDFNYPAEHNKEIAEYVRKNKVDTVTCFNVLNVLDTKEAISNMCLMAAKALKDNGTAYFQVYHKKDGKGASQNNQSYQQGEPLSFYVPFVSEYFENVKKTAELITASKPKKTAKKSQWQFAFDSDEGILFGLGGVDDYSHWTTRAIIPSVIKKHLNTDRGAHLWKYLQNLDDSEKIVVSVLIKDKRKHNTVVASVLAQKKDGNVVYNAYDGKWQVPYAGRHLLESDTDLDTAIDNAFKGIKLDLEESIGARLHPDSPLYKFSKDNYNVVYEYGAFYNADSDKEKFTPGTLIRYKDFDGTIYKIVDTTADGYVVEDLSMPENLRTKNTIPFDNDNLLTECNLQTLELTTLQNPQLGNVVYENIPLPFDMQLAGLPDDDVELQFTEMKLLEIEKLHDFGEKIGGSAKDRYNGRHSQSGSGNSTNTQKGFNRLPTMEEVEELIENYDDFCDKFKPSVADFEQLGLNKICARIFFFIYYGDADTSPMDSRTAYNKMIDCAQDLEKQNQISEFFLDNKRTLIYSDYSPQNISYRYLYYTALSMNLEKEMKDDFSYQAVLKLLNRGNKYWREYRFWCIFNSNKVSADVKQKVFNIEYENVTNNYPVYRVMLSNKGVIFTVQNELTENKRSYRHSQKYVTVVSNALAKDWNDVWQNYADYYVKGKQLWEEKYGNEEKWKFTDKDGLVAEKRLNCKDWRNGKNAETTDFINTFGFRAVEFGETMPQKERWEHLNRTYDAFMDLCDILNIKPENISLGGTLGICFGSRGRGGKHAAAAHYEPGKRVINLTRKNGAGCLAHEWFHAFDNQVCDAGFGSENAVSLSDEWRSNKVFYYFNSFLLCTETMNWHMFEFVRAAFALNRYERRSKPYWQKKLECAARAFEWYVITKLAEKDRINEYLAQIPKPEPDRLNYYPYPHEADYGSCKQIFDGIFENVVQEKTKYNFFTIKG